MRAPQLRQLHGKGSDATSSSVNKHLLPFLQSTNFKQSLPGSCSCKWHRRRLHVVEPLRLRSDRLNSYRGILRIGSAVSAHEAVHILADAEVCHSLARCHDDPCHIYADNSGQLKWYHTCQPPFAQRQVERIDRCSSDLDQYLTWLRLGTRYILVFQHFETTVLVETNGFHDGCICGDHGFYSFHRSRE